MGLAFLKKLFQLIENRLVYFCKMFLTIVDRRELFSFEELPPSSFPKDEFSFGQLSCHDTSLGCKSRKFWNEEEWVYGSISGNKGRELNGIFCFFAQKPFAHF